MSFTLRVVNAEPESSDTTTSSAPPSRPDTPSKLLADSTTATAAAAVSDNNAATAGGSLEESALPRVPSYPTFNQDGPSRRQSTNINPSMVSSFVSAAGSINPNNSISEDTSSLATLESMSEQELKWKLKEALAVIKEKERDLIIAAEIGQQLVAANNNLAAEYEELKSLRSRELSTNLQQQLQASPISAEPSLPSPPHPIAHDVSQEPQFTTFAASSDHSAKALKASKRASMSLNMSSLLSAAEPSTKDNDLVEEGEQLSSPSTPKMSIKSPVDKSMNRKSSTGIYSYVMDLEKMNADVKEQLSTALANLQDAESIHSRTIANLRKTNASLQEQLHSTLERLRDSEQAHNQAVSTFEKDLDSLRSELSHASLVALELETQKRKLIREKVDVIRESNSLETADTRVISDLQRRVRELEDQLDKATASKKDAERKLKAAKDELEEQKVLCLELHQRVESAVGLQEECERRGALILELKEQLEDIRNYAENSSEDQLFKAATSVTKRRTGPANSEFSIVLQKGGMEWQWSPWLSSVREKMWERDVNGLREEIADLAVHREAAYVKLRESLDEMLGVFVKALPTPLQGPTRWVVGVSPPETPASAPSAASEAAETPKEAQ